MRVRYVKTRDEGTMPRQIIFGRTTKQLFSQPFAISGQKTASGELRPAHHEELHADQNANESQIAEPSLLLRSIHPGRATAGAHVECARTFGGGDDSKIGAVAT